MDDKTIKTTEVKAAPAPSLCITFKAPLSHALEEAIDWLTAGPHQPWQPVTWCPSDDPGQATSLPLGSIIEARHTLEALRPQAAHGSRFVLSVDNHENDTGPGPIGLLSFVINQISQWPMPVVLTCRAPTAGAPALPHAAAPGQIVQGKARVLLPSAAALPHEIAPPQSADFDHVLEPWVQAARGYALPDMGGLATATERIARIVSRLRAPDGCPWDREQTFASLRPFMIEEAYEAHEAATRLSETEAGSRDRTEAAAGLADELGDVLLQVLLNAQLAAEEGLFDLSDVAEGLSNKMVRRHPHVFADAGAAKADSADDVRQLWENVKASEASQEPGSTKPRSLLHAAAKKTSLPTLEYAAAVSKRASRLGFCWVTLEDVWQDVENEIHELKHEITDRSSEPQPHSVARIADEIGDVVYTLANLVVHLRLEHGLTTLAFDDAVRQGVRKFVNRFAEMEAIYREDHGVDLTEDRAKNLDLQTWNDLWKRAKVRRYR